MSRDLRENARLERLIGRSPLSPSGIAVNEKTKKVAYLAGKSTIVISSLNGFGKETHIQGTISNAQFTTLDFSTCGRYIVTGESGAGARVRVWELAENNSKSPHRGGQQIRELQLHSNTISAVKFTVNGNFVISAGGEQDGHLVVWDWRQSRSVFQGKLSGPVGALAVSPDSSQVVSVGNRSVKYWTLPLSPEYIDKERDFNMRSAILADKRSLVFIDAVYISPSRLLVASQDGQVIELVNKKFVRTYTWVDKGLLTSSLALTAAGVAVGFDDGSVRILSIDSDSLSHADELRCPLFVGGDPAMVKDPASFSEFQHIPNGARSASVCAIRSDSGNDLIVAHADRSLVFYRKEDAAWMFRGTSQAHVGTVTDIQFYPPQFEYLPRGSFITCARDGTVKIWNLHPSNLAESSKNLLCPNLLKVIPLEDDYEALIDSVHSSPPPPSSTGLSCLRISPDGQHLVVGSHNGHLHLVDLADPDCVHFDSIAAHEGTVTAVTFSDFKVKEYPMLLASSGVDHFVHIFKRSGTYQPIYVLSEHHSPVMNCMFAEGPMNAYLYTTSLDRLMIQWRLDCDAEGVVFIRDSQEQLSFEVKDIQQTRAGQKIAAACGDGQIRTFEPGRIETSTKNRGVEVDGRSAIDSISFDPTGSYALTILQDNHIALIDIRNSQCLAVISAVGSSATAVTFSDDCKTVLYTSADGCIFVYRLANAVVSRMAATKRAVEEAMRRTPSPDSLLGSESEDISEFSRYTSPEFDSDTSFELSTAGGHFLSLPVTSRIKSASPSRNSLLPTIQQAQVTRRSTSNLLGADFTNQGGEASDYESQSDFVSTKRTPYVEVPQEETSSSMINLRDANGLQSARPVLITRNVEMSGASHGQLPPKTRRKWADLPPEPIDTNSNYYGMPLSTEHQPISTHVHVPPPTVPRTTSFGVSWSPSSVNSTASMTSSMSSASSPSFAGGVAHQNNQYRLQQSQTNDSSFGRQNKERESLSRRHMQEGGVSNEQRTIWSPLSSSPATQPRRVSNVATARNTALPPSGAAAAALLRRPADDYFSSNLHLRSRSQSPNKLAVQAGLAANSSTELTKGMQQKRRDSDMSYSMIATSGLSTSRSNLRSGAGGDETRKSTEALNKLAAVRSKLHQSSENLRKSSDNLAIFNSSSTQEMPKSVRTTSSGNLRHSLGGAVAQLEPFGTFDVDVRSRSGSMSSLAHSRILARSMGNINASSSSNGSIQPSSAPRKKLQDTLDMLKKASNPDLTQMDQYDDSASNSIVGEGTRLRGAVQKRVDRYRPRNRVTMRNQTSEESDSNTSDASPLNQSIRRTGAFSGGVAGNRYGDSSTSSCQANRRLYEQQQGRPSPASTPRRTTNYLAQRMNGDAAGPDLGSDDSPRSSINSADWQQLLGQRGDAASSQLVRHVQDCMDQLQVCADKTIQAKKMVENDSSLSEDVKRIIICQLDLTMERTKEKLANPTNKPEDRNGNDYTPMKNTQVYAMLKQNLSNR